MSQGTYDGVVMINSFPRSRGDEPSLGGAHTLANLFSPLTRG